MEEKSAEEQAKEAISYVLNRIREERKVANVIGSGTQSFSLLPEAAATLYNDPIDKVREFYAALYTSSE
jgi:hypothetical protein